MLLSFSLRTKKRRKKYPALLFWRFIVKVFWCAERSNFSLPAILPLIIPRGYFADMQRGSYYQNEKGQWERCTITRGKRNSLCEKKCFFLRNPISLPKNVSCNRRIVFVSPGLILSVSYDFLLSFSYNCCSCLFFFSTNFPLPRLFV